MAAAENLLETFSLVTITGLTGMGKTRLAVEAAWRLRPKYLNGIFVVELGSVVDPGLVPKAVAEAVGVRDQGSRSLGEAIADKLLNKRALLILDNCEHVVQEVFSLTTTLLQNATEVRILATSHEPLGIEGETVLRLGPLSVPKPAKEPTKEAIVESEAGQLFFARARASNPDFDLTPAIASAVAEICRRLDGIPLAIELAAARVGTLSPMEIVERLDERFHLLTSGPRPTVFRHETLEAALSWSYELLTEAQKALLRRLSVFPSSFALEAIEHVCTGEEVSEQDVLDLVSELIAKSLVTTETVEERTRYRLLETIRGYGGERLVEAEEESWIKKNHSEWCLSFVDRAQKGIAGPDQRLWLQRIELEHDNIRAALQWTAAEDPESGLKLAAGMTLFWRIRGHFGEGRSWLETMLDTCVSCPAYVRAKAHWGAGLLAAMLGDFPAATRHAEKGQDAARQAGDSEQEAWSLNLQGFVSMFVQGPQSAIPLLEQAASLSREANDPWCLADSLARLGHAYMYQADVSAARPAFEESLRVAREIGDDHTVAYGLMGLGWVRHLEKDPAAAEKMLQEALALSRKMGEKYRIAETLSFLADTARSRGDRQQAEAFLEECLKLADELESAVLKARSSRALGTLKAQQGRREEATHAFRRGIEAARPAGLSYILVRCLLGLGDVLLDEAEWGKARACFEEALSVARDKTDQQGLAQALTSLATMAGSEGETARAASLFTEALPIQTRIGLPGALRSLENLANLASAQNRFDRAARLLAAAHSMRVAGRLCPCHSGARPPEHYPQVPKLREAMGLSQFEAVWAQGAAMSLEEAVSYATRGRGTRDRPGTGLESLTATQREVIELAAEGLTNAEIAERLYISPRTVGHHISSSYRKLGVKSRKELRVKLKVQQTSAPS